MRPALLLALLAAASASAQDAPPDGAVTGPRAEALADSLFGALVEAERVAFGAATTVALHSAEGALFLRVGPDGVDCAGAFRSDMLEGFGEMFCLSPAVLFDGAEDEEEVGAIRVAVWEAPWEGATARVIRADGIEDADGMESMELWVADGPLRLVRLRAAGEIEPGMPMDVLVERGDFREAGGVVVPHRFRLVWNDPAALLAGSGVTPEAFLDEARAQAQATPTADAAALVTFAKAVAAGTPYELALVVDRVEADGPVPPGLFDAE